MTRAAWLYVATVAVTAASLIARGPFGHVPWVSLAALAALNVVCESAAASLTPRRLAWSTGSAVTLASVVLLGPVGAALVGAVTVFGVRSGRAAAKRIFNGAMYALSAYTAGAVFVAFGGTVGIPRPAAFPAIIGPFTAAAAAHVIANHGLLGGVLWLTGRPDGQRRLRRAFDIRLPVPDLGYAAFGLLIAALWGVMGPFAEVMAVIPLLVARWAITQFAAQQQAYEATLGVLCQAVETKDFYTRGHSERVARGSVMIAREVGMRHERVEAIRYAGMLHDVGKLGVPTRVLQKTGRLTEEEYAAIQLHPMRGLEIVREIGFLDEALAGIMHHHERMDGRGYPMGLAGDEIPEFARVLAVADAFDCMTSTRSYRGARSVAEAITELRKCAGTQFDPAFVDALIAAVERDGWATPKPPVPEPGQEIHTAAYDHDDPTYPLPLAADR